MKQIIANIHNTTCIIILAACLSGCGLTRNAYLNHYFPVKNIEERQSSLGFSIQPPLGHGWYEKLSNNTLYYLKRLHTKDYSIYTKATEIQLGKDSLLEKEIFLMYVKNKKKLDTARGDYRNITFNYAQDTALSPYCVRYTQNYDDYSKKHQLRDEFIRVKNRGLVCMHPEKTGTGVDMYYVERYLSSRTTEEKSYRNEAEFFLSSLRFRPSDG